MSDLAYRNAYEWYLGSEFWAEKRRCAMERANYICQRCHKARAIEVHHKTYVRVFNELVSDLLPVCSACHREIHHLKPANDNQLSLPFPITDDGCARGSTPQQRNLPDELRSRPLCPASAALCQS